MIPHKGLLVPPIIAVYTYFSCSDAGIHDRVVIQELLKETAQSQNLESVQKDFKGIPFQSHPSPRLILSLFFCSGCVD